MLGTDTHERSKFGGLVKYISIVYSGASTTGLNEARQHRHCGRFTCTILTEKCKDLVAIHFDVEAFDRLEPVVVGFLQVLDSEVVASGFLPHHLSGRLFVAVCLEISHLELVIARF
jgi:hypothetical protein